MDVQEQSDVGRTLEGLLVAGRRRLQVAGESPLETLSWLRQELAQLPEPQPAPDE